MEVVVVADEEEVNVAAAAARHLEMPRLVVHPLRNLQVTVHAVRISLDRLRCHMVQMELLLGVQNELIGGGPRVGDRFKVILPNIRSLRGVVVSVRAAVLAAAPKLDARLPPFGLSFGPDELVHRIQQQREEAGAAIFCDDTKRRQRSIGGMRIGRGDGTLHETWLIDGFGRLHRHRLRRRLFPPLPPPRPRLPRFRRVSCVHDARRRMPKIDGHPPAGAAARSRVVQCAGGLTLRIVPAPPPRQGASAIGGAVATEAAAEAVTVARAEPSAVEGKITLPARLGARGHPVPAGTG